MNFNEYELGFQPAGAVVEVTLSGTAANVVLLDWPNLSAFRAGRNYRYHGGHTTVSPVHLTVPADGQWYVVVNLGGYIGKVHTSCRVLAPTS